MCAYKFPGGWGGMQGVTGWRPTEGKQKLQQEDQSGEGSSEHRWHQKSLRYKNISNTPQPEKPNVVQNSATDTFTKSFQSICWIPNSPLPVLNLLYGPFSWVWRLPDQKGRPLSLHLWQTQAAHTVHQRESPPPPPSVHRIYFDVSSGGLLRLIRHRCLSGLFTFTDVTVAIVGLNIIDASDLHTEKIKRV